MKSTYSSLIKRATWLAVLTAMLLVSIKLFTWWITDSISLLASLLDSSMDLFASGINFFLIRYALKPADKEHRFGHGKAESLAALAQSAFIIGSAVFLLLSSFKLLIHPHPIENIGFGIAVSVISMAITFALVSYQKYVIKRTNNSAIRADMLHYFADFLMNLAVVCALILSWCGFMYADAIFALAIGCYIFYSALKMSFNAIQDLLDKALPDAENQQIIQIVSSYTEIYGFHDLKTRRSGRMTFVQLHVELDEALPLLEAHRIADSIEKQISAAFQPAEVIVHQDPVSPLRRKNIQQ